MHATAAHYVTTEGQYLKRAVKRGRGNLSTFHLDCQCGARLSVAFPDGPDVACRCGIVYDARGWIVE